MQRKDGGFNRLMVAQDVGSAIKGPERGDIYFGSGEKAGKIAGVTKHPGNFFVLVPVSARRRISRRALPWQTTDAGRPLKQRRASAAHDLSARGARALGARRTDVEADQAKGPRARRAGDGCAGRSATSARARQGREGSCASRERGISPRAG